MEDNSLSTNTDLGSHSDISGKRRSISALTVIFLITTVLAVVAAIYFYNGKSQQTTIATTLTTDLNASEGRYADLNSKYSAVLTDIESLKGKNAELDKILSEKEKAITDLQANLNKEKKKYNISEADYKAQLDNLNLIIADLNTKVTGLEQEKAMLALQKDSLGKNLFEKEARVVELQSTNATLSRKVTVASLLVPTNIETSGSFSKSSGKEAATLRANRSEQLRICFDVPANKVADPGEKIFVIRIISPQGAVLALQENGSGLFNDAKTNEEKQFSTTAAIEYAQEPKSVCAHWSQSMPYQSGQYTAEIYQDGFFVGKQEFELR